VHLVPGGPSLVQQPGGVFQQAVVEIDGEARHHRVVDRGGRDPVRAAEVEQPRQVHTEALEADGIPDFPPLRRERHAAAPRRHRLHARERRPQVRAGVVPARLADAVRGRGDLGHPADQGAGIGEDRLGRASQEAGHGAHGGRHVAAMVRREVVGVRQRREHVSEGQVVAGSRGGSHAQLRQWRLAFRGFRRASP
jgi:hypothetical protein